jgi:sugar/nucleoside kinase (ribokinase family)/sugar phosphate isomerase/epimerase
MLLTNLCCSNRSNISAVLLLLASVPAIEWTTAANILVVGSVNADTFLPVARLPTEGENVVLRPGCQPTVDIPGGKGCTQAVAASKLMVADDEHQADEQLISKEGVDSGATTKRSSVAFVGQFGRDAAADILEQALEDANVDISNCGHHDTLPSGRGYVFITESGSVSAVVSGGSNAGGWTTWEQRWNNHSNKDDRVDDDDCMSSRQLEELLDGVQYVMLQREVPEYVNLLIATEAQRRGLCVLQDVGGEDRPISSEMLRMCDYVVPNESELNRLVASLAAMTGTSDSSEDDEPTSASEGESPSESTSESASTSSEEDDDEIVTKAKLLQAHGARNVLVTRGSKGCVLLSEHGDVWRQPACRLSPDKVVDETGAGDCFRAAFCVALLEQQKSISECLAFASAAGACGVMAQGAVPATPTREQVDTKYHQEMVMHIPRGGATIKSDDDKFPFLFGSRLNSMKDRPELWGGPLKDARDYVKRQATIEGLTCVDFNYPQHFPTWSSMEAKQALHDAGLVAGAVCLRYPAKFARGAMNHPDPVLRREAIDLTKEAAQVARDLGCDEVVVWSAYDGYDYPFQVDYDEKWAQLVDAFQECCDAFPDIKFSIEYKPTDENTRFFTVPSTGAAIILAKDVDRTNFGLTLDVGHMLMSGENPGQSIAMAGKHLFGVQLNDGYTRLAAEDGMMFGSVHPSMALEIIYQLRRVNFSGHFYFDTFPQRTDPIKEAEYNIRRVKKFWAAVERLDEKVVRKIASEHDALGALELVDEALRSL